MGSPFNNLKNVNEIFASVATDSNYNKRVILTYVKPVHKDSVILFREH